MFCIWRNIAYQVNLISTITKVVRNIRHHSLCSAPSECINIQKYFFHIFALYTNSAEILSVFFYHNAALVVQYTDFHIYKFSKKLRHHFLHTILFTTPV